MACFTQTVALSLAFLSCGLMTFTYVGSYWLRGQAAHFTKIHTPCVELYGDVRRGLFSCCDDVQCYYLNVGDVMETLTSAGSDSIAIVLGGVGLLLSLVALPLVIASACCVTSALVAKWAGALNVLSGLCTIGAIAAYVIGHVDFGHQAEVQTLYIGVYLGLSGGVLAIVGGSLNIHDGRSKTY